MYSDRCSADERLVLRRFLSPKVEGNNLDAATKTVAHRADGGFLYLQLFREAHRATNVLTMSDLKRLPIGLSAFFLTEFRRVCSNGQLAPTSVMQVVEPIVVAAAPLHVQDELPILSRCETGHFAAVRHQISLLFPVSRDGRIRVVHKSIVDWLTRAPPYEDRPVSNYAINRRAAHRRLAQSCAVRLLRILTEHLANESDKAAACKLNKLLLQPAEGVEALLPAPLEYARQWACLHLLEMGETEAQDTAVALLFSLGYLSMRVTAGLLNSVVDECGRTELAAVPDARLLQQALKSSRRSIGLGASLVEELSQRLPEAQDSNSPAGMLQRDARHQARQLPLSALHRILDEANGPVIDSLHNEGSKALARCELPNGLPGLVACSTGRTLTIWDLESSQVWRTHVFRLLSDAQSSQQGAWEVMAVACYSLPDGPRVVCGCSDGPIRIWSEQSDITLTDSNQPSVTAYLDVWTDGTVKIKLLAANSCLKVDCNTAKDGTATVVGGYNDGSLRVWNGVTPRLLLRHHLRGHQVNNVPPFPREASVAEVKSLAMFRLPGEGDGRDRLVSCASHDTRLLLWTLEAGGKAHPLGQHRNAESAVAWCLHEHETRVVSFGNGEVRIWDPVLGNLLQSLTIAVFNVCVFNDGPFFCINNLNAVCVWNRDFMSDSWIQHCTSDDSSLWSSSDADRNEDFLNLRPHAMESVFVNGKHCVAVASGAKIVLLDPSKEVHRHSWIECPWRIHGIACWTANEKPWLVSTHELSTDVWNPMSRDSVRAPSFELRPERFPEIFGCNEVGGPVACFKLENDLQPCVVSTFRASPMGPSSMFVWKPLGVEPNGQFQVLFQTQWEESYIHRVTAAKGIIVAVFSGGRTEMGNSADNMVRVWSPDQSPTPEQFRLLAEYPLEYQPDDDVVTSHTNRHESDRSLVMTEKANNRMRVHRLCDGHVVRELQGHVQPVSTIAVPDDNRALLASGSEDRTLRLWRLDRNEEPLVLTGHQERIVAVAFFILGGYLRIASTSADQTLRVWDGVWDRARSAPPICTLVLPVTPLARGLAAGSWGCIVCSEKVIVPFIATGVHFGEDGASLGTDMPTRSIEWITDAFRPADETARGNVFENPHPHAPPVPLGDIEEDSLCSTRLWPRAWLHSTVNWQVVRLPCLLVTAVRLVEKVVERTTGEVERLGPGIFLVAGARRLARHILTASHHRAVPFVVSTPSTVYSYHAATCTIAIRVLLRGRRQDKATRAAALRAERLSRTICRSSYLTN